jgi:hypothetical protein
VQILNDRLVNWFDEGFWHFIVASFVDNCQDIGTARVQRRANMESRSILSNGAPATGGRDQFATRPDDAALKSEQIENSAWTDAMLRVPAVKREQWDLMLQRIGGATVYAFMRGEPPSPRLNRITGLGSSQPAAQDELDEALSLLNRAEVKRFIVQLLPAAEDSDLPRWLDARGLAPAWREVKLWRNSAPPPDFDTDLRIEVIGRDSAKAFAELVTQVGGAPPAFAPILESIVGQPGWTHYMAFDGDVAVASAARFDQDGGSWLGQAATSPMYRRRGTQSALLARRIADGLEAGSRWFASETADSAADRPNTSLNNMLRAGFQIAGLRTNWSMRRAG